MKFGLNNISALLRFFDNPHAKYPSIHIAGTNGKGSTSAMLSSVLQTAGYRVGLYTSPHIIDVTERILVNGKPISLIRLDELIEQCRQEVVTLRSTYFETLTAIAFTYFAEQKIDVAVVETGLGGRLDATNVITPVLSIITNISLEHTEMLGNSIAAITREKGGIVKRGIPCVTGVESDESKRVLKAIAQKKKSPLLFSVDEVNVHTASISVKKIMCDVRTDSSVMKNLEVGLGGFFQEKNIATVTLSLEVLRGLRGKQAGKFFLTEKNIYDGMKQLRARTNFAGRLDVISENPLTILDVAHNPDALNKLVDSALLLFPKRGVVVFGLMKDKNLDGALLQLARLNVPIIAVQPKTERAVDSLAIVERCHHFQIQCLDGGTVGGGIAFGKQLIDRNEYLLVCGSFFVAGEAMQFLCKKI